MATALEGLAAVAEQGGARVEAARLGGAATALREQLARAGQAVGGAGEERRLVAAQVRQGEEATEAAWAEGRAAPLEVVTEVLTLSDSPHGPRAIHVRGE
jgi:hypothetical protein